MPTPQEFARRWPLARIRAVGPRVELRLPTDDELFDLIDAFAEGVHDPAYMPFAQPWSDAAPEDMGRNLLAWHWSRRAACTPSSWTLILGVFVDGAIVGVQDLMADQFAQRRVAASASALARRMQGLGIGTEMRDVLLALAFEGLGARVAESGAYEDNAASLRVSEKCGYEPNGVRDVIRSRGPLAPGGASSDVVPELRLRLTAERWRARTNRPPVALHGLEPDVRSLLGAG